MSWRKITTPRKISILSIAALACCAVSYPGARGQQQAPVAKVGTNATVTATQAALRGTGENPEAVARGGQLFAANCGSCHGATAKGTDIGTDLIRSKLVDDDVGKGDTSCFGNCDRSGVAEDSTKGQLIGPVIRNGVLDKEHA